MNHRELLGKGLKIQLEKGYNIARISRWALSYYHDHLRLLDSSSKNILHYLLRMEDDPQFEFTEEELT